jgi:mRNA-degrading endonuclease RelE of RelBE toxin-antitoxin system
MKHEFSKNFLNELYNFPLSTRKKFEKQLKFLILDIRHPSLHAKKYDESADVWQARVDKSVRFFFKINDDTFTLLSIQSHPK